MMTKVQCRKRLAIVWFVFSAIPLIVLIIQTNTGVYADKVNEAWSWFLPAIMPTLSLITGVFISDISDSNADQPANVFIYRLTLGLSILYLLALISVLFSGLYTDGAPLATMKRSSIYLGPIQGLVAGVMGVFFVKK